MLDSLCHAGRAAGEVDEHDVFARDARFASRPRELIALVFNKRVERQPSLALAGNEHALLDGGRLGQSQLGLLHDVGIVHADHHFDARASGAVDDVLFRQLQRRGNDGRAQFAESHRAHPVLPAAAKDHHHDVAFADPQTRKRVSRFVGKLGDVGERERALFAVIVAPNERALVGLDARPFVNDVEPEVKYLRHLNTEVLIKVFVRIELDAGTVFLQNVIHDIPFQYL